MPQKVASSGFNSPKETAIPLVQVLVQVAPQFGFNDLIDPMVTEMPVYYQDAV